MKVTIDVSLHQLLVLIDSLSSERIRYHQMIMEGSLGREAAAKKIIVVDELLRKFEDDSSA